MDKPSEQEPDIFQYEASMGIADVPVLDQATTDVALDHIFTTSDEVTKDYNSRIFELQQRLLVENLTPSERIEIREAIGQLTITLEAIMGAFATAAERIEG